MRTQYFDAYTSIQIGVSNQDAQALSTMLFKVVGYVNHFSSQSL
jgi:hypothetical protein